MKIFKEMIEVMLIHSDIKTILLGEFTKLKLQHREEIAKKKLPNVLLKILTF